MLKAIIFDLDGVLIDSEQLMREAFKASYHQVFDRDSPEMVETYLEHMGEAFPQIIDQLGLPRSLWEPYHEYCQQHIEQIRLFPMSRDILEWACANQMKLAILTGKDRERTLQILDHFEIDHFFDLVVTSDQLQRSKPDPEGMFHALYSLDIAAADAVMVGDAVSDILCAQRASVTAIAVTWGTKPELVQTQCKPDYIVHDWRSLFSLLAKLYEVDDTQRQGN
jgi:AHBA synthesis associated protein